MNSPIRGISAVAFAFGALCLPACGGQSHSPGNGSEMIPVSQIRPNGWRSKIKHVVIIVQENRSFNNLFYGFPGAKTAKFGYDSHGDKITLAPISLATTWDLEHAADGFFKACDGKGEYPGTDCRMDGFDKEIVGCGGDSEPKCPMRYPEYSYAPRAEVAPYWSMAKQYVLADEMFASNFDASSFVSHQYIISGQAESSIDYPTSLWGCPGGKNDKVAKVGQQRNYPDGYERPCWNPTTLGDELDTAGLTWAFFAPPLGRGDGIWSSYQTIDHIYNGPDWKRDVFEPSSQFFTNLKDGDFRSVTWIMPGYTNSDHPGSDSKTGPSWVTSIVNAIGLSPYWGSTAIFVFWDDYGGFYDSEPPAHLDYDGLGLRLPMLIISPYAVHGKVSHVHYEHGSILRFIEDVFGLPRLAASDGRANSPANDCFDFYQLPRKFKIISAPYGRSFFERQAVDYRPPDAE